MAGAPPEPVGGVPPAPGAALPDVPDPAAPALFVSVLDPTLAHAESTNNPMHTIVDVDLT